ncbi:MAG: hypothetical protein V2B15_08700 [Bacteroidota bacterium]
MKTIFLVTLTTLFIGCASERHVIYPEQFESAIETSKYIIIKPRSPILYNGMSMADFRSKIDSAFVAHQMQIDSLKAIIDLQ